MGNGAGMSSPAVRAVLHREADAIAQAIKDIFTNPVERPPLAGIGGSLQ